MTPRTTTPLPKRSSTDIQTLGVVSFLNALPLYDSLTGRDDLAIIPAVPSQLYAMLADERCDVALLPIVDYWLARDRLAQVSDACIASDGETMTVRIFSKTPPDRIKRLHVDGDSHTSVVLARLIWLELYATRLDLVPRAADSAHPAPADDLSQNCGTGVSPVIRHGRDARATGGLGIGTEQVEAVLLIGDKVVRESRRGFGFEVDLAAAWKHLTGLPFVFAAWYGAKDRDHTAVAAMLQTARDAGMTQIDRIAAEQAPRHGWPEDAALRYLRDIMVYTLTDDMRAAMDHFFKLAAKHGLLS